MPLVCVVLRPIGVARQHVSNEAASSGISETVTRFRTVEPEQTRVSGVEDLSVRKELTAANVY